MYILKSFAIVSVQILVFFWRDMGNGKSVGLIIRNISSVANQLNRV